MQLVIFDVDGTLTDTNDVDGLCFKLAFQKEFGLSILSTDWETYTHTTDLGIATEILTSFFTRPPLLSEIDPVRLRFLNELKQAHLTNPDQFRQIPGAAAALQHLQDQTDFKIAIATGCWAASAFFKLAKAGLDCKFPFASCEDAISRDGIVRSAIEKAKSHYGSNQISTTVYVGDGTWDATTARNLGIEFIGICPDEKRSRLEAAGAKFISNNFSGDFLQHLSHFNGNYV